MFDWEQEYYTICDALIDIIDEDTDIDVCCGWIGEYFPKDAFPEKYKKFTNYIPFEYDIDERMCDWDNNTLHAKLVSSEEVMVYEKDSTVCTMTNIQLVSIEDLTTKKRTPLGVFDFRKNELIYFKDIKILKLPVFDGYINAATKIQRMWRKYVATRNNAAKVIQRAFLDYLYHPNNNLVKKLEQDFYIHANAITV
jgi:hypothetical protein